MKYLFLLLLVSCGTDPEKVKTNEEILAEINFDLLVSGAPYIWKMENVEGLKMLDVPGTWDDRILDLDYDFAAIRVDTIPFYFWIDEDEQQKKELRIMTKFVHSSIKYWEGDLMVVLTADYRACGEDSATVDHLIGLYPKSLTTEYMGNKPAEELIKICF